MEAMQHSPSESPGANLDRENLLSLGVQEGGETE